MSNKDNKSEICYLEMFAQLGEIIEILFYISIIYLIVAQLMGLFKKQYIILYCEYWDIWENPEATKYVRVILDLVLMPCNTYSTFKFTPANNNNYQTFFFHWF